MKNERKLEIADISGYLLYKPQVVVDIDGFKIVANIHGHVDTELVIGYYVEADPQGEIIPISQGDDESNDYCLDELERMFCHEVRPLLIPMSAIDKPMTIDGYNNGEPFVPIIELMKRTPNDYSFELAYCDEISLEEDFYQLDCGIIEYYWLMDDDDFRCSTIQLSLLDYQLLYQWHFDVNDLIGQGLAINKMEYYENCEIVTE